MVSPTRTVPARTVGDTIARIDVPRAAVARNRLEPVTRSADRMAQMARKGKSKLHKLTRYATTDLKLRTEPRSNGHGSSQQLESRTGKRCCGKQCARPPEGRCRL